MIHKMDYQFPQQLFPSFYNCGPPDSVLRHCAGKWGSYDLVRPQGGSGPLSSRTFTSRHQVRAETWRHTEPVPVPLLSPKNAFLWPSKPPDPLDFTDHMQNFFMDHSQDAFGCMSELLSENFQPGPTAKCDIRDPVKIKSFLDMLKIKMDSQSPSCQLLDSYGVLLWDVVSTVPPELLGSLLFEELMEQRDRMLFSEGTTGGALAFVPFSQNGSKSQHGCLLYPGNQDLDCLNFHRVVLQHHRGTTSCVDASSSDTFSFQLKGPIRQISATSLLNDCCAAVRSDRLCGVWRFSESSEPRLLQVVNTREVLTCVSVSPHVLGEVLVASESGAANLWTVGRGTQKVREEDSNLYFNAKSWWRWCEFSAHPRVMLYADRTGAELTDMRTSPVSSHTLFRVSDAPESRRGERLILSRYLGDVHSFHHLITTQYSAYIVDERFPCVPMLKWDHLMESPPMFCQAVRDAASTKVLLGSQSSQQITLLQYSGGRAEACSSRGPPQALLRPRDSLKHLPVQIPHRLDVATSRLSSPAAGLTCIQKRGGDEECICVLQLTEAGDIFYQILEPEQPDASEPRAAEDQLLQPAALKEATPSGIKPANQLQPRSQPLILDTSSDESVVGPTQHQFVAETPEREQGALEIDSNTDSDDSESGRRHRYLKHLGLQVVVNDDPDLDEVINGEGGEDGGGEETISSSGRSERHTAAKLSDGALVTWKHWLQKLVQKSRKKTPRSRHQQHITVETEHLLHKHNDMVRDSTEEERVQSLRRDLRACMNKRSLLVHGAVTASLPAPDVVAVPDSVDTEVWKDQISQRLTLSWQGEGAWRAWWDDHLGLNWEKKVEALRIKRRLEKQAKRPYSQRLDLSGSFTTSLSYQSDLTDFSDSIGWSSYSDMKSLTSQSEDVVESETPRATTPSSMRTDTPVPTPTGTPQSVKHKPADWQTPSGSCTPSRSQTLKPESTPTNQRRAKRPADNYLSSLFAPQDEPSQHNGHFLEEENSVQRLPSSSSQRSLRVDLSQDASLRSGFSQSSQVRPRASQPKRKKPRMGF